jgi:hypothetical protein
VSKWVYGFSSFLTNKNRNKICFSLHEMKIKWHDVVLYNSSASFIFLLFWALFPSNHCPRGFLFLSYLPTSFFFLFLDFREIHFCFSFFNF